MHRLALTVAGAAQAWRQQPRTCFPFILGGGKPPRHLKARIIYARAAVEDRGARLTVRTPPPIVAAMHAELETLEAKIRQVAELCHNLRRDNIALRQQLLATQQDNKQLTTRLDAAKTRLHAILETLPEDV
jgi:cell division protein ZapB